MPATPMTFSLRLCELTESSQNLARAAVLLAGGIWREESSALGGTVIRVRGTTPADVLLALADRRFRGLSDRPRVAELLERER